MLQNQAMSRFQAMSRLSNVASCGQLCLQSNSAVGRPRSSSRNLQREIAVGNYGNMRRSGRVCVMDLDGIGNIGRKIPLCPTLRVPDALTRAGAELTGSTPTP